MIKNVYLHLDVLDRRSHLSQNLVTFLLDYNDPDFTEAKTDSSRRVTLFLTRTNMVVRELERLRLSFEGATPPIIPTGSSDASVSTPVPRVHVLASPEAPVVDVIGSSVSHDVPPRTPSELRRSRSYTYPSSANPNVRATAVNES